MEKKRILKLSAAMLLVAACGIAALLIYVKTGLGIPCVFNEITGLKCPGCGNTHSVLSLLKLDIKGALSANIMFPVEFGYIAYVFGVCTVSYLKGGKFRYYPDVRAVDVIFLVAVIIWWILRNIISL